MRSRGAMFTDVIAGRVSMVQNHGGDPADGARGQLRKPP